MPVALLTVIERIPASRQGTQTLYDMIIAARAILGPDDAGLVGSARMSLTPLARISTHAVEAPTIMVATLLMNALC